MLAKRVPKRDAAETEVPDQYHFPAFEQARAGVKQHKVLNGCAADAQLPDLPVSIPPNPRIRPTVASECPAAVSQDSDVPIGCLEPVHGGKPGQAALPGNAVPRVYDGSERRTTSLSNEGTADFPLLPLPEIWQLRRDHVQQRLCLNGSDAPSRSAFSCNPPLVLHDRERADPFTRSQHIPSASYCPLLRFLCTMRVHGDASQILERCRVYLSRNGRPCGAGDVVAHAQRMRRSNL